MTIRARLILLIILVSSGVVVSTSAYFVIQNRSAHMKKLEERKKTIHDSLARKGETLARNVALSSTRAIVVSDFLFLNEIVQTTVANEPELLYGIIIDNEKKALVHSDKTKMLTVLDGPSVEYAIKQNSLSRQEIAIDNEPILEIINPIQIEKEKWGTIIFGFSLKNLGELTQKAERDISKRIQTDIIISSMAAILLMIIAALIGAFASSYIVRPLNKVVPAIKSIADGDLNTRLETNAKAPELKALVRAFNKMSDAVRERDEAIREKINSLNDEVANRIEAEDKTRRLRNYLSNIVDSMPSILVGVDSEGNVTQWNKEAENTTGLSPSGAIGKKLDTVLPIVEGGMQIVRLAITEKTLHKESKILRQAEKGQRWDDLTVYPLTSNGIQGAVVRIDDVTDRVRLEEMMVQTEKMMSVGGLAAGMAHEINNPLAGIMQSMQVVKNRFSETLKKNTDVAEQHQLSLAQINLYLDDRGILSHFDNIQNAAQRASKIVSNMLSFSRKSGSSLILHNLSEILNRTLDIASNDYDLKKNFDFRKINIVREFKDNIPPVLCESSEIQQVLLNLLKNGAHAMAEGIDSPQFVLRIYQKNNMAYLEVEDNGAGMEETTRTRIFEPFFTTKDVGEGTGLGLSVSYFIITENHRGTMEVVSTLERGTTFIIGLPIGKPSAKQAKRLET